ncbi:MAG: UDP-N-acetylmuramyl-tripeptide synthetase [bacterium]|nr:UDP-N-acetylmuramyl-tripeptide synthetase [bacterium]
MPREIKGSAAKIIPAPIFGRCLSAYHFFLAGLGALLYGYPSRYLLVIGVTGTKGKTTVTEMINAILEEAGHTTCVMNSIRFKLAERSERNLSRMSMPGRFFIQKFLQDALKAGCTAAVLEMTSEGARQHRHRFLDLDALVFTNLAPEHIESHGSYEAYADAKFELGRQLVRSHKRPRIIVANADDKESSRYLTLPVEHSLPVSLFAHEPLAADELGGYFTFDVAKISLSLPGTFSLRNALLSATLSRALGIRTPVIATALGRMRNIPGRAERIDADQDFTIVVDYAHTPDSLAAIYDAYKHMKKICVLGASGGGRDTWKRPVMGRIAEEHCNQVILTNEDPYDEDPQKIIDEVAGDRNFKKILDRREAIREAIKSAKNGDTIIITGKGAEPWLMGPNGAKIPWDDREVVREELNKI